MKIKKITKKLVINKKTVANLSIDAMDSLNGGGVPLAVTATACPPNPCMTAGVYVCTWNWECDPTGPIVCP
jgi:hypothetical protein